MNSKAKFTILLLFMQLPLNTVFCQESGKPFIRNYSPKEYGAATQNWAIVQDYRGVMYFGNNHGVLEYDGTTWQLIEIPNKSIVRSLDIDTAGTIFVGAVGEFGYLSPDSIGKLQYNSLSILLDSTYKNFADVWQVLVTKQGVYFWTSEILFKYNPQYLYNESIIKKCKIDTAMCQFIIWYPENRLMFLFNINDTVYSQQQNVGIIQIVDDSLYLIRDGAQYADKWISTILPYNDGQFLFRESQGFFIYDPKKQKENRFLKQSKLDNLHQFLIENQLYKACVLPDNKFVFATFRNGIVIVNKKCRITELINKQRGLIDNNVYYPYHNNQQIWLALANGISHAEWGSPIRFWNETSGLRGTIYDIIRHKEILFVSTSLGLFYQEQDHFREIENIKTQSWSFLDYSPPDTKFPSILLIGTNYGIYEIKGTLSDGFSANLIKRNPAVSKLYQSPSEPTKIYAGLENGLAVMHYTKGKWKEQEKINGITEEIMYIAEDKDTNLWLGTRYNGVIRIAPGAKQDSAYKIDYFDTTAGLPVNDLIGIYHYNDYLLFATPGGFYKFDYDVQQFVPDSSMGHEFANRTIGIERIAFDHKGNCWIGANPNKAFTEVLIKQNNGKFVRDTIPFKRIPPMTVEAIYPESNGLTWIGGPEGLFCYDGNKKYDYYKPFHTLIRKVTVGSDSVVFWGAGIGCSGYNILVDKQSEKNDDKIILEYKDNSIIFNYSAQYFSPEETNLYSYYLEGYDPGKSVWSIWSKETKKEYTNLPEGSYTFHVKAKNIYGIESITATYNFRILPPWYRTFLAYVFYIIAGILVIRFSGILYSRRLKAANIRLEKTVAMRTREIRKQKEDIEEKNTELEQQKDEINTQKDEIEKQRDIVIQQKQEITDSIIYAKRIQIAVLPPNDIITRNLSQYFILFKPRDIVSGDFYWMKKVDNLLIITIADCTGHGVPGAFMSMLGIALLNDIVRYKEIATASQVLNELRNQVKAALRQSGKEGEAEDGMDMSLCVIDFENMKMQFAGAKNPLYIIRNNELIIIKADKMPIGIYYKDNQSFTNHEIDIQKDDVFYMFSDGFIDQFGSSEDVKFTSGRFKNLLTEIHLKPMQEQKKILEKTLENWKTDKEQVDDITVVGFRI